MKFARPIILYVKLIFGDASNVFNFKPDCPQCQAEAGLPSYGSGQVNPPLHSADIGKNDTVVVSDAIHHGDGTYVTVPADKDPLKGKPSVDDLKHGLQNALHNSSIKHFLAEKMLINALEKRAALAEKEAHEADHHVQALKKLEEHAMIQDKKDPEQLGKETQEVAVFPAHTLPFGHHNGLLFTKINTVRNGDRMKIEAEQTAAKLYDLTKIMAMHGIKIPWVHNSGKGGMYYPTNLDSGIFYVMSNGHSADGHIDDAANHIDHADINPTKPPSFPGYSPLLTNQELASAYDQGNMVLVH